MTTDQLALLQTIILNPADDAPRLIYADWLEENGQPERAELIRVQCQIARLESLGVHQGRSCNVTGRCSECHREAEHRDLRRRERELLMIFWKHWFGFEGLWQCTNCNCLREDADIGLVTFSRGFISEITCTADTWLRIAPALVWREGERETCHECHGMKEIKYYLMDGNYYESPCWHCDGHGTAPRPMPETVQPIERVRLTTRPDEGFGGFRSVTFIPVAEDYRQSRSIMTFVPEARVEYYHWPGIVFELPDSNVMPPQVRAVRRDMG